MLKENYDAVAKKVKDACERAGRSADEVTIIAVSKTKPLSDIVELQQYGVMDFGENKVQELCAKYEEIEKPVRWHLIGHLQTNKVKYIVDKVELIHSVDSLKLAKQISKEALKKKVTVPILIQVNVAQEETKFGLETEEVMALISEAAKLPNIKIKGLMTIAPFVDDPEDNRQYFRMLKQLFVDIGAKNFDNVDMTILSMGMTNDYEVAVEEGATMVRVGTGIFGARNYNI
ncbi:MAG TPA: YggS family pyridoxal phosphate-dependent enzyme [Candidatus Fimousia stercorigallinarum]|nr:YggS family pyridoxal phosphate-dependent enzyme [Candidatus Fimousia stercorigallinarum]